MPVGNWRFYYALFASVPFVLLMFGLNLRKALTSAGIDGVAGR